MALSSLPFILDNAVFFLSLGASFAGTEARLTFLLLPVVFAGRLALALRHSFNFHHAALLDLGAYECPGLAPCAQGSRPSVLWHYYNVAGSRLLVLLWGSSKISPTVEILFRNAKWLEREAAEMHGWFFKGKRDRRGLFLVPVFFASPLEKSFPVGGFYELTLCPLSSKLTFRHTSWLS